MICNKMLPKYAIEMCQITKIGQIIVIFLILGLQYLHKNLHQVSTNT